MTINILSTSPNQIKREEMKNTEAENSIVTQRIQISAKIGLLTIYLTLTSWYCIPGNQTRCET